MTKEPTAIGAMTIDSFCRWADIGRTLTYKEIGAGRLKAVKVGNRRLIPYSEAERWLAALPRS